MCSSKPREHCNNSVQYILLTIMWDSSGCQRYSVFSRQGSQLQN